jgi:hypothetical protein
MTRWLVGVLLLYMVFSRASFAAPSITSLSPTSAAIGASVTITGTNFGTTQGTSTVTFNGTAATTITSWTATSIVATVPTGATTGSVVVTVSAVASNTKFFTVVSAPSITSLSPTSGAVGASVTITGTSLGSTGVVTFNGTTATTTSWSSTRIIATVPTGATTGNVVVYASGVDSGGSSFTVVPAPSITSLSPTSGAAGASVTITGTNFGTTQGTSTVTFNGTTATTITSWTATSIVATVPTAATTGNVVVYAGGVDSNGVAFTVLPTPSITSLSPTSGAVGVSVTISGAHFGSTESIVTFNGTTATTITSWTATSIVATVPTGASTGNVVVYASGVDSNGVAFTVLPNITSLSPTSGAVGASVTIAGTSFGATAGTVKFNGTTATTITSWTATSIVATVPTGASTGNVVVTANGAASSGVSFTVVPAPRITSLSPASGAVGASVTITGTSFGTTMGTVTFNGTTATTITSWTATSIVATVPTGASTGSVVVNASGVNSNTASFTVVPAPSITRLSPVLGPVGTSVTIAGANFGSTQGTGTVAFNGLPATTITSWTAMSIVATVPTGASTGNVVVNTSGVASNGVTFSIPTPNFTLTGSLGAARLSHTATLLNNGDVLVAGGVTAFSYLGGEDISSAEVYNSTAATFSSTGSLNTARAYYTATLLPNGEVLMAGGADSNANAIGTAELYNSAIGTFAFTGSLNTARENHTATLLPDGEVLIAGGSVNTWTPIGTAELYNPTTGTFTFTGNLNNARLLGTATLLNNGKVLIVGGYGSNFEILSSAELYDPVAGTFTPTGSLNIGRADHQATLLNNGLVLIAGGYNANNIAPAELYDPSTGTFTLTGSMNFPRYDDDGGPPVPGVLLNNGMVLLAGGQDNNGNTLASAELYDPSSGTFTVTGTMTNTREALTTTLLNNGQVLIAAGINYYNSVLNTAELYQPSTLTPSGLVSISVSPSNPSVAVGATQLFTATGTFSDNSTEILASVAWSPSNSAIASIANDSSNKGNAVAIKVGSATVSACAGSVCGSTTMAVNAGAPLITWAPPAAIIYGTALSANQLDASSGEVQGTFTYTPPAGTVLPVGSNTLSATFVPTDTTDYTTVTTTVPLTVLPLMFAPPIGTVAGDGFAGYNGDAIPAINAEINYPAAVAVDSAGNIYIADEENNRIRKVTALTGNISTVAGNGMYCGVPDGDGGPATSASLCEAFGVAVDSAGNIYIADSANNRIRVVNTGTAPITIATIMIPAGDIATVAGDGTAGYNGDNIPAITAWLEGAVSVAVDSAGNIYIADSDNNRIRKVTASTGIITTVAGNGTYCGNPDGDGGPATSASLCEAVGIGLDSAGNIYITDVYGGRVRVVNTGSASTTIATIVVPAGDIARVAGGGSGCSQQTDSVGDGCPATSADLDEPYGVAVDSAGNIYIADAANELIREVTGSTGIISTVAGNSTYCGVPDGDGGPAISASLCFPAAVAVNGADNIYISDQENQRIREVYQSGIAFLSPSAGAVGTLVTINGGNFGSVQGTVTFNGTPATISSWSANLIVTAVPIGATSGNVVVTANGVMSNGSPFTVISVPSISLSPNSGGPGTVVTITGTNFGASQGTSAVLFNGAVATPTNWAATTIQVPVPANASTGPVVVIVDGVSSNGVLFTDTSAPIITTISPPSGTPGTTVTINGSLFGASQGTSTVTFNGEATVPTNWNANGGQIVAPAPLDVTTGNVVVTVNGIASNGILFTAAPTIASLSPASGGIGTAVTISGTNFGSPQGTSTVTFGTTAATPLSWSKSSIVVPVPSGATNGNVVVTVGGVASSGTPFTVTSAPGISSISPVSGNVGTSVTINGSGFGTSMGTSTVTFNGVLATTFGSWSATQILATVPPGGIPGPIVVTVNNLVSNAIQFAAPPGTPQIALSLTQGPPQMGFVITGTNLDPNGNNTVMIGNTQVPIVSTIPNADTISLTVQVPAGAAQGFADVVVTVGLGPVFTTSNAVPFNVIPIFGCALPQQ